MRFQIICSLLCLSFTTPALADGMRYTTLGSKKGQLNPPELTLKSLNFGTEANKRKDAANAEAAEQKTFEDVWQRYRTLAEGRAADETAETAETPRKTIKPKLISARPAATQEEKVAVPTPPAAPYVRSIARVQPASGGSAAHDSSPDYSETPLPDHVTTRPMGIIDQYEQSKARRSQMKTLRISRPETEGSGQPQAAPPEMHHLQMSPPQMKPAPDSADAPQG